MTSENSSSIKNRTIQKSLFRRRLWVTALAFLVFFIYNAGFTIYFMMTGKLTSPKTAEFVSAFATDVRETNYIGVAAITVIGAVLLGLQGFAWIDRKREIDFFESLPVTRSRRFWNLAVNSLLIYLISYVATLVVGLIIAAAGGAWSEQFFCCEMETLLRNICLFTAVYGSSVFAVVLTGNIVIAIFAEAFFLLYEPAMDLILSVYKSAMLKTYVDSGTVWTHIFSPLTTPMLDLVPGMLINLAGGAVTIALACIVYRYRKNEDAGKAVLHAPVRWIVKIAASAAAALVSGMLFYEAGGMAAGCIASFITACVAGCILEVIYNFNIRKAFRHFAGSLIAGAISITVLFCFRFDVTGFDRWVPDPEDVSSAYVVGLTDYSGYIEDNGDMTYDVTEYAEKHMKLTDISSVNALLAEGEKYTIRTSSNSGFVDTDSATYSTFVIGYRMKNGKTLSRQVEIPGADSKLLDKVVDSEEFREGYFQIWNDSYIEKNLKTATIGYWNGKADGAYGDREYSTLSAGKVYEEFRKAYRQDLEKFSYSYASTHAPIGNIEIEIRDMSIDPDEESNYRNVDMPVYETFENTIAFAKKYGIYQKPVSSSDEGYEDAVANLDGPFYIYTDR